MMNLKRKRSTLFVLVLCGVCLVCTTAALTRPLADQGIAVTTFLKLFDALDDNRDGVVPLVVIFEALNLERAEARQVKRARALDGNGDGLVTRAEARAGIHAELTYQINRGMNTDVDGDDALTPQEYALSFPDPNGKAEANGITPLQMRSFKGDDLDGDGKITRAEIEMRIVQAYETIYWSQWCAVRARRADRNGDRFIDEREFAVLEGLPPDAPLPAEVQKRFQIAGAQDGKLSLTAIANLFPRSNVRARAEIEKMLEAFEARLSKAHIANGEKQ
jgi:Ca2+-binding EF-hand superfamily protein